MPSTAIAKRQRSATPFVIVGTCVCERVRMCMCACVCTHMHASMHECVSVQAISTFNDKTCPSGQSLCASLGRRAPITAPGELNNNVYF